MRYLTLILMLLVAVPRVRAQQDVSFAHYWAAQSLYNPAAMALDGMLDVRMTYAMQMTGFEHSPTTIMATADMPLFFISNAHALGVTFLNDKLGLFTHNKFALGYAYHQRLGKKGHLSGGVRFGLLSEGFDGSGLDLIDASDPAFPTSNAKGTGFDLDAGLHYKWKDRWYVGASMHHITSPVVSLGDEKMYEYKVASGYYLTGGWSMAFRNPQFRFLADGILRTDLLVWRADVAVRLQFEGERFNMYAGAGCSPTNSVTLLLGTRFHGMEIGYAYEAYTSAIGMLSGSHELTLGYKMDLSRFKKGRNLHKSVRLL